jgi:large subunit ribosomal protein L35
MHSAPVAKSARADYAPALSARASGEPPGQCGLPRRFRVAKPEETKMPKLKTKSGVKKRFKLTATGLLKHGVAGKRHRLLHHNGKYIRQNRGTKVLAKSDTAAVKAWAPYGLS